LAFSEEVHDKFAELARGSLFVGISVVTPTFHKAREISSQLRRRLKIPIVWGGSHVHAKPSECLQDADAICRGEGEAVAVTLARRLRDSGPIDDIPGLSTSKDDLSWAPPTSPALIPSPDYSTDGSHWSATSQSICPINTQNAHVHLGGFDYFLAPTRGCPYACTYCINSLYSKAYGRSFGNRFRRRPVESVIDELVVAVRRLPGIRRIKMDDDCFMASPLEHIEEFSAEYEKRVGLPLVIRGVHPRTIDEAKLDCLCRAGLVTLRMGIQTGSDRIRQMYKRDWETNEQILDTAKLINGFIRKGMLKWVLYDIIVDNPWETEEDRTQTFNLVRALPRPFALLVYSLRFYPGTPLYERAIAEKRISGDTLGDEYWRCFFDAQATPINVVYKLYMAWNLHPRLARFLARPHRLAAVLRRVLTVLAQEFPEISLLGGGRIKTEILGSLAMSPESLPPFLLELDLRQKANGAQRIVFWLRAIFRWAYGKTIARRVLSRFVANHPGFHKSPFAIRKGT